MPSLMIHVAIGNEVNKVLKRDRNKLLIGTIAPDISKIIGESRATSHFIKEGSIDIPDTNKFLEKYQKYLSDDFVMGYYIHLYADYLWFTYFVPEIYDKEKNLVTKIDGTVIKCEEDIAVSYIYNDYNNINKQLVDKYQIDLNFLYEETPKIDNIIEEIDINKLDIIQNKTREIHESNLKQQNIIFDMDNVDSFIKLSIKLIINNLKEIQTKE